MRKRSVRKAQIVGGEARLRAHYFVTDEVRCSGGFQFQPAEQSGAVSSFRFTAHDRLHQRRTNAVPSVVEQQVLRLLREAIKISGRDGDDRRRKWEIISATHRSTRP